MNLKVSTLIGMLIMCEVYAQRYRKFQYTTHNDPRTNDESHLISFPKSAEESTEVNKVTGVPLELLEELNNVSNVSEFFDKFIDKDSMDSLELIQSRFDETNVERSVGVIAKPALCQPQETIVPLEPLNKSTDPTIIYFPTCTRVNRCAGCCSSPLLECQPIESETITFLIYKSQYTGGRTTKLRGKEVVLVDQHKQCRCDCKIKQSDCKPYQYYDARICQCVCSNHDERTKCFREEEKIWDAEKCQCKCRITSGCTTGTYFDQRTCRCVKEYEVPHGLNETAVLQDRKRFIIKAIPVIPDDNGQNNSEIYEL